MEQKDYLLREIEKIGLIISAIRQKLFGGKGNLSLTVENQFETLKEMLLTETNFDFDKFLSLNIEESNEYICSFKGFSAENIEHLAECISEMCLRDKYRGSKNYLEKALQLYELCNSKSKTYSSEREATIMSIKSVL
ncbi:MAG: hypothetical protein AB9833_05130 [Bacteroidales bacterium]